MPSSKKPRTPWIGFAKFAAVVALIFLGLSLFRPTDRDRLVRAANKGYEIVEPSSEYLRSKASFQEIVNWAQKGNPDAQLRLVYVYWQGTREISIDLDKAVEWAKRVTENEGSPQALDAANVLWVIYEQDFPPEKQDKAEAEKWLRFQADRGDSFAATLMGMRCLGFYGAKVRPNEAFQYFKKSADKGDGNAIYWLGECYANGWGVGASPDRAILYLTKASDLEQPFIYQSLAQRKLAEAYKYGYGVVKNSKQAFEYFKKSALGGDLVSMMGVAQAYSSGAGVVPSNSMALLWIYVNAACGGVADQKLIQMMEESFMPSDLSIIRGKARETVAQIEARKEILDGSKLPPPKEKAVSSGTGVVVSPDGLVVTAAHVVDGSSKIEVVTPEGKRSATVVETDSKNDLAILRIGGSGYKAVPLVPSRDIKLGQSVFTIGFPNTDIQGASPKFTKGEISSISGIRDEPTQWQISVPVQSGNSGSPLFDESGNVVGIVVSKLNAFKTAEQTGDLIQNVNYAVKNAYLVPMLEKFPDKLPAPKKRGMFKKFESVVEDSKKSVVLILAH